jgi:hypothetical protein
MGTIIDQMEGPGARAQQGVRCPLCGAPNTSNGQCRHVRWTFDRGGPLDFARHALSASPFSQRLGRNTAALNAEWMQAHGEEVIDLIMLHFGVDEGFVFGEIAQLDMLSRDMWRIFDGAAVAG